jgi:hypothetical protein
VSDIDPSTNLSDALSELIAFDAEGRAIWPAKQLEAMLREPLEIHGGEPLQRLLSQAQPPIRTAQELMEHPNPTLELLAAVKDLSKRHKTDCRSVLPPEMTLLLYYGSIAAALVRCEKRITKLRDDDLRNGFTWIIKQPWASEGVRELFRQALRKLTGGQNWRE